MGTATHTVMVGALPFTPCLEAALLQMASDLLLRKVNVEFPPITTYFLVYTLMYVQKLKEVHKSYTLVLDTICPSIATFECPGFMAFPY